MSAPVCIDLFCGAGGLSTGLLDAGVAVRTGIDNNSPSIETFDLNHRQRGARGLRKDVRQLTGADLRDIAGGTIHLLAGGPPCQPFSVAGKRRGLEDVRGDLIFEFVRLLKASQADSFLFENVPNLATVEDGKILAALKESFNEVGYTANSAVLYAADYGVPQMRKRLFILGTRGATIPMPPAPTHEGNNFAMKLKPYVTVSEALDDLPDVDSPAAETVPNHEPTFHSERMLAAFAQLEPGKRDRKSRHDRLHPDRLGYTLRAGTGNFSPLRPVHHKHNRVLTVRECARLQSFSDTFIWPDTMARLQQYRQVGNAVPPLLAQVVAEHLAAVLGWDLEPGRFRVDGPPASTRLSLTQRIERRQKFMRGGASGSMVTDAYMRVLDVLDARTNDTDSAERFSDNSAALTC
jgi:DNA (cytosine-5)-methyltransferase 1